MKRNFTHLLLTISLMLAAACSPDRDIKIDATNFNPLPEEGIITTPADVICKLRRSGSLSDQTSVRTELKRHCRKGDSSLLCEASDLINSKVGHAKLGTDDEIVFYFLLQGDTAMYTGYQRALATGEAGCYSISR